VLGSSNVKPPALLGKIDAQLASLARCGVVPVRQHNVAAMASLKSNQIVAFSTGLKNEERDRTIVARCRAGAGRISPIDVWSNDDMPVSDEVTENRVRRFCEDYADTLDEGRLEQWPEYFAPQSSYRVVSRENHDAGLPVGFINCMNKNMICDRITAIIHTAIYEPRSLRHFISGVRILKKDGVRIEAKSNFLVIESLSDREPTISVVGQYIDVFVETGNEILIERRDCVLDNYRIRTSLIVPV